MARLARCRMMVVADALTSSSRPPLHAVVESAVLPGATVFGQRPARRLLRSRRAHRRGPRVTLFDYFEACCEGAMAVDREARASSGSMKPHARALGLADVAAALGKPVEDVIPHNLMREVVQSGRPILLDIMLARCARSLVVTRLPLTDEHGAVIAQSAPCSTTIPLAAAADDQVLACAPSSTPPGASSPPFPPRPLPAR